jgi:hypothetical protein
MITRDGTGRTLTTQQRRALERLGPDGRQAALLADGNGPSRAPAAPAGQSDGVAPDDSGPGGRADPSPKLQDTPSDSGLIATVVHALGGDGGGMGRLLPGLLLATLLVAALLGFRRRSA